MNKTVEMYQALLLDLQKNIYKPENQIHRKYICSNNTGIIYSMSVGDRMRSIEIPVDNTVKNTSFPTWKGVKIDLVIMPKYSPDTQLYIEIQQRPGTEPYIFEIVVDDLRRSIDATESCEDSTKCTIERLKKWKDFFATGKLPILTGSVAQGLYGELLFLQEIIEKYGSVAIYYWAGANNETHDFYIGQNAVEIKTTSTQAPYMAHINNEYQLDNHDVNGNLFLRMYALRKGLNGGQKIPEIIEQIRLLLAVDSLAKNNFESKLNKVGYLDAAEDYYQEGYTIREIYSFEIKEGFPRIVKSDLPNGIYDLEYDVSVAQCVDYAIETKELIERVNR